MLYSSETVQIHWCSRAIAYNATRAANVLNSAVKQLIASKMGVFVCMVYVCVLCVQYTRCTQIYYVDIDFYFGCD